MCVVLEHVTREGGREHERDSMLMPRQKENFHHLLDFNKKERGVLFLYFLGFVSSTIKPCLFLFENLGKFLSLFLSCFLHQK